MQKAKDKNNRWKIHIIEKGLIFLKNVKTSYKGFKILNSLTPPTPPPNKTGQVCRGKIYKSLEIKK